MTIILEAEIDDAEFLERAVEAHWLADGLLFWKALRLFERDHGGMSLIRLAVGEIEAKARAKESRRSYGGFAETRAGTLRRYRHAVRDSREDAYVGHAEADLYEPPEPPPRGGWPDEPEANQKLEDERTYYEQLVPLFEVHVDLDPASNGWVGTPLGTVPLEN
ncbi:MAG: hypothetical protein WDM88_09485 [Galbitalea sp.]